MKVCQDCKHFSRIEYGKPGTRDYSLQLICRNSLDPVNGGTYPSTPDKERRSGYCGYEGRSFEQK
jgi:hypothetical protein